MNETTQSNIEVAAVLDLVPYLDQNFGTIPPKGIPISQLLDRVERTEDNAGAYDALKSAIEKNSTLGEYRLMNQSTCEVDGTWRDSCSDDWTSELIQGCTFKSPDDDYFVSYRGTGDGRWVDNGVGLAEINTPMQQAAASYFDAMAEKYFQQAHIEGHDIYVSGHSKGGNEGQYTYMAAEYSYLISECYNFDGQGFSPEAIEYFKRIWGDEYEERLKNMYSVCGSNDYVHDLGIVIIPEENTYFVDYVGEGMGAMHGLEFILTDEDGNYRGLTWTIDGKPVEQGEYGKLAKEISKRLMNMDKEDRRGVAIAVMTLVDAAFNGHLGDIVSGDFKEYILGDTKYTLRDFIDLLAHGVPEVLKAVLTTEEGREMLKEMLADLIKKFYEEHGLLATIGAGILAVVAGAVAAVLAGAIIIVANIVDFVFDIIEKLEEIKDKVVEFLHGVKDALVNFVKSIKNALRKLSRSYKEANNHPHVKIDTSLLRQYGTTLKRANQTITSLDWQLDSLYKSLTLSGKYKLLRADFSIGYSFKLAALSRYMEKTADDFEKVENSVRNSI